MAVAVLTDPVRDISVLYCTTTDRPLSHESFRGSDSEEQAEHFLAWLDCDPRDTDALSGMGYCDGELQLGTTGLLAWYPALDHALAAWRAVAFQNDEFAPVTP